MSSGLVGGLDEFSRINYWKESERLRDINMSNILRLFNLWNISDEELEEKVNELLDLNLDNPEVITYINTLYKKWIKTYQEVFLIDLKAPFSNESFDDKGDIINFLKCTSISKNKERRQIYCDLVKIMFCYHEVEKHPEMKNAEKNTKEFVSENYLNGDAFNVGKFDLDLSKIMGKKEDEDYFETKWTYSKKMPGGNFKRMNCTLRFRGKSTEKMVIKMLWSEKWNANVLEIINDSMGIELEAENKKESIYLLEYEYFVHKDKGNINQTDFRQKLWFYSEEDIDNFSIQEGLSNEFRIYLLEELKELKKPHGTMKYQDCKFQWMVTLPNGRTNGLESRVVIMWNKNQSGLSSSKIVDGKKIISAMIWLRWWVSERYINRIVNEISLNPDIKKDVSHIFKDFTKKLVGINVPKLGKRIYSSQLRLEEVVKNGYEYPDFIVNAITMKFYPKSSLCEVEKAVKEWTQKALIA